MKFARCHKNRTEPRKTADSFFISKLAANLIESLPQFFCYLKTAAIFLIKKELNKEKKGQKLFLPTSQGRQFKVVHLGQRDNQGELGVVHTQLEERPPPDDLQRRQHDLRHFYVGDQDVAGDLADVLQEAQVQVLVLQPRQLQVAVDVGAVGVAVAEVAVVVLAVVGDGHAAVGADANWKKKKKNCQQKGKFNKQCFKLSYSMTTIKCIFLFFKIGIVSQFKM